MEYKNRLAHIRKGHPEFLTAFVKKRIGPASPLYSGIITLHMKDMILTL